jgi:drug/metabolite transporter (DMT)-like permease
MAVAGVYFLSLSETKPTPAGVGKSFPRRGSTWALASALFISIYSVSDNFAVVWTPPSVYIWWVFLGNFVFLIPFVWKRSRRKGNVVEIKSRWGRISVAGAASLVAYLAVLFALKLTSVSYVVTGRALSVLFAAVFGVVLLKERFGPMRILGAALMILGMATIAIVGS